MTEQQLSQFEAVNESAEPADPWRNEVQDRLARYKRRRGRRIEGAFTMRFPFPADDPAVPEEPSLSAFAVASAVADMLAQEEVERPMVAPAPLDDDRPSEFTAEAAAEVAPLSIEETPAVVDLVLEAPVAEELEPGPFVDPHPRPKPKRKVIAFPRQHSVTVEAEYRLADPVTAEVPRILDVPEELEATPFLDGLQLDLPDAANVEASRDHIELPGQPVNVSLRVLAGAIDLAIAGVGAGVFAAVAFKILPELPPAKLLVLGTVTSLVVLWSAYQYLFVVYAGKTLGMMAARIRLRTFKGRSLNMRQRQLRVLTFFLSSLSLGMGLMWAFVDVDSFCWHDRLSQTFLARRG